MIIRIKTFRVVLGNITDRSITDRDKQGKVTGASIIDRDNQSSFNLFISDNHEGHHLHSRCEKLNKRKRSIPNTLDRDTTGLLQGYWLLQVLCLKSLNFFSQSQEMTLYWLLLLNWKTKKKLNPFTGSSIKICVTNCFITGRRNTTPIPPLPGVKQ